MATQVSDAKTDLKHINTLSLSLVYVCKQISMEERHQMFVDANGVAQHALPVGYSMRFHRACCRGHTARS